MIYTISDNAFKEFNMLAGELLSYIKVKKICGDIEKIDIKYISEDSRNIKEGTAFIGSSTL